MANKKVSGKCSICEKPVRRFRIYEDKMLCYKCFVKQPGVIGSLGKPRMTLREALDKTYYVNFYEYSGQTLSSISVSSVLAGHRVKLVLADDKEDEEQKFVFKELKEVNKV